MPHNRRQSRSRTPTGGKAEALLPTGGKAEALLPTGGKAEALLPTGGKAEALLPTGGKAEAVLATGGKAVLSSTSVTHYRLGEYPQVHGNIGGTFLRSCGSPVVSQ
jgi:hypothetical protein